MEIDRIWDHLRDQIRAIKMVEKSMSKYFNDMVLRHDTFEKALGYILSKKLAIEKFPTKSLWSIFEENLTTSDICRQAIRIDLKAVTQRDPAARGLAEPFLHSKGYHALEAYRISHVLWNRKNHDLALFLHSRIAEVFSVDIHPAARIGKGILIDHATGVVIGETAVVGDDVSLLHEVTLGGTGKERGDRHPKVGSGVLIGAGAKILGNIRIGEGSKVGAGSVVLGDVPPHSTVAGVPARIVGHPKTAKPALSMDQAIDSEVQIDLSYASSML
jgi:serine O-acetyltransferase